MARAALAPQLRPGLVAVLPVLRSRTRWLAAVGTVADPAGTGRRVLPAP